MAGCEARIAKHATTEAQAVEERAHLEDAFERSCRSALEAGARVLHAQRPLLSTLATCGWLELIP